MRQLKISQLITTRETASLEKYFQEISRVNLLSVEQEVELARAIRAGDDVALEKLVMANLRFVVSVAKQYQNRGISLGDLINEGNVGLIKAARRFDETRGFKFISYAVWWIRQSMIQALGEKSRTIRVPISRVSLLSNINRKFSELEQKFEREPSIDEVASALDLDLDLAHEAWRAGLRQLSLEAPRSGDDDLTLSDSLAVDQAPTDADLAYSESLQCDVKRCLKILNGNESMVLSNYYGLGGVKPLTLDEISARLKISPERVRQIKDGGLRKLRDKADSLDLHSFL